MKLEDVKRYVQSQEAVRNYRFRIYPNREQEQKLLAMAGDLPLDIQYCTRPEKRSMGKEKRSVSRIEQQVWLKLATQKLTSAFGKYIPQAAQEVLFRVDRAFAAFFRGVKNGETPGGIPASKVEDVTNRLPTPSLGKGKELPSKTAN